MRQPDDTQCPVRTEDFLGFPGPSGYNPSVLTIPSTYRTTSQDSSLYILPFLPRLPSAVSTQAVPFSKRTLTVCSERALSQPSKPNPEWPTL